ncbi:hypothetical protein D3C87_228250 [compost metagenome]
MEKALVAYSFHHEEYKELVEERSFKTGCFKLKYAEDAKWRVSLYKIYFKTMTGNRIGMRGSLRNGVSVRNLVPGNICDGFHDCQT